MILNCGNGTVDIAVHRMLADGEQQSIMAPRGGAWGSTSIDRAFVAELASVFGADVIAKFKAQCADEFLSMLEVFGQRRVDLKPEPPLDSRIDMPIGLEDLVELLPVGVVDRALAAAGISYDRRRRRLMLSHAFMMRLFGLVLEPMMLEVAAILREIPCDHVFLVGEFSDSPVLLERVQRQCRLSGRPSLAITRPVRTASAVMEGAVRFGINRLTKASRSLPRSYESSVAVEGSARHEWVRVCRLQHQ